MERTNRYVLRARNFWRENKRVFVLMGIAAVFGMVMAAANTWNYNKTVNKFQLEESQPITNSKDARFNFSLSQPDITSEATLTVEVNNSQEQSLDVNLNGENVGTVNNDETTIRLPGDALQEENTVVITRQDLAFNDQALVDASVTARTNLQQLAFVAINFASLLLIFLPIGAKKYVEFQRQKKMEDEFPAFLRDVVEGTRAGMSLPQAVQNTTDGSYGPLDPHIEKMSAQIEWGVPFDEILEEFGRKTGSSMVKRSVDTIIQAYTSGGDIQDVLESVGENIRSIRQLKQQRQSQLYGEMITGYIVYLIFIGILVALTTYLLPNLAQASESLGSTGGVIEFLGQGGATNLQENIQLYQTWFSRLVYIQALFSGLIIGKLSEGKMTAGLKHMAILFAIGYLSTTFFF